MRVGLLLCSNLFKLKKAGDLIGCQSRIRQAQKH
nr:MAG TPA: hypothetical protein [Caudoviricetes sp.]